MEQRKYAQYDISDDLKAQVLSEIARAKTLTKTKDYEIAQALGKTKQGYSAMVSNNLSRLGSIEAIANALGFDVEIKFVKRRQDDGQK